MKKPLFTTILFLIILYFCSFSALGIVEDNRVENNNVENKRITLDEAIKITLDANLNIKIEKLNVDIAKNEIKIANKLQNPSIGTFQNMGPVGRSEPQQIGADYVIEVLKRGKRKNFAKIKAKATENNRKFYEYNLISEVQKAYIDLILKKANLKIINEQLNLSKELYEKLEFDYKTNKAAKTDAIQAKIDYNRAIMYRNIAKSEVITSQNHLNIVMNTPEINYDTKEDTLKDNFRTLNALNPKAKTPDFETIKNYALNKREDLIKAKNEIDMAQANLKIVKSQLIPDVELSGGYGYQTKGYNEDHENVSGAYAGVNIVNIPLVYQYKPEIKNAQIEIERAQLNYENTKIDVVRDITDAWEKFTIAKNNLNFYDDELLVNSKELIRESKKNLDNKTIDLTDFLVSKKLYLELILGYEQALAEYYVSYFELLKEMNADLGTNLGANSDKIENL